MGDAEELVNLLEETISVLKSAVGEDIENIRGVAEVKHDLYKSYIARQESLKNVLQNLSEHVRQLDIASQSSHHEQYVMAFAGLQDDKKYLLQEINRLESESERHKQRAINCKQEAAEIERKQQDAERIHSIDVPRIRIMLNLYCNLSGIKWDYDASTVKGVIWGKKEVVPFDLNPKKLSEIELTNELWNLIESSQ